ncbi:NAD-glutamate dehydrogenase, partial [Rhizobium sp. 23-156E]
IYTVLTRLLLKTSMVKSEIGETVGRLQAAAKKLRPLLSSRIPAEFAAEIDARRNDYAAAGVPEGLAGEIAALGTFLLVPDVMQIAEQTGEALARAAETYFEVSQTFRVSRLLVSGSRIVTGDHYENLALARSLDRIATARRDIVISALNAHPQDRQPLAAWHASDRIRINRIAEELAGLSEGGEANLARITVAAGLLGDLAHDLPR